ncbi:hypothetical protein FN846DRAFT_962720 [Sphaerosporella brunnea]|uniref:Uncharacterized protein n=1 Tax=Sphaerosporella brunnea TaxID=1250544 RepID=A0A5J5EMV4_9PEZI|nr:hypothetical protein FN846DRAFT_962720 [Sphaerosporella brunnea]
MQLLPHHLRHVMFTGHVWTLHHLPGLKDIPLFIANKPLLLPVPCSPPTTTPYPFQPPEDPWTEALDPLKVIPKEAIDLALQTFRGADALLVFFSGSLIAVYNEKQEIDQIPETFGGLRVTVTRHGSFLPTTPAKEEGFTSEDTGSKIEGADTGSNDSVDHQTPHSRPSSPLDSRESLQLEPVRDVFVPGERVWVHGPRFGQDAAPHLRYGNYLYRDAFGAAGVLVRLDGDDFLTTTTHTSALFTEYCKKAWDELPVVNRLSSIFKFKDTPEPVKMDVFRGNVERVKFGTIVRTFDPDAVQGYPRGYRHDLSLIKLENPAEMRSPELTWNSDPLSLFFNRPIKLLSSIPPPVAEGVAVPVEWGATIGQAVCRVIGGNDTEEVSEQFSRCYLWRTYGFFRSIQGWSGSPLTVSDEGGRTSVFGFQNWEWTRIGDARWNDNFKDMVATTEEEAQELAESGQYSFYGSYFLPPVIKSAKILSTKIKQA